MDKILQSFERKEYCSAAFLDIFQAFDRVWHEGLLYKIKINFPGNLFNILKSYLEDRYFLVNVGEAFTNLHLIRTGILQGSVLEPILYLLFTADLPTNRSVTVGTFADDTAVLASHPDPEVASATLQSSLNSISCWTIKWRIKVNEMKSFHVTFTIRRENCPPVRLNNTEVPQVEYVKYLGIYLGRKLIWKKHIFIKRKQLRLQLRKMYWILGRNSQLNLTNKLLLYTVILKPIWTYGIQLWGTASHSNIEILQRFQSKMLRIITNAPWFVTNDTLHHDLNIPTVKEEIGSKVKI